MKDFPLEEMSPTSFEQLALALCVHVMGADVQAFGIGRDGGREATYHGEIVWPTGEQSGEPEKWDGYTVVQAKMKLIKSNDPGENLKWLKSEISKEIDAWTDANTKRGTIPDNILFVTNVRLSSAPSAGGIDQINKFIGDKMKKVHYRRRISKWRVWHRDQLVTYLNAYQGIRQAFPALLTAGDVLSRLGQVGIRSSSETRAKAMIDYAIRAIYDERWLDFSEAQHSGQVSIDKVVIDLPIRSYQEGEDAHRNVEGKYILSHLVQHAEKVHAPMVAGASKAHRVVTGAPGNGKSTISQFIVQMYRARFIADEQLSSQTQQILRSISAAARRNGVNIPRHKRWPIRVDLAEYAQDYAVGKPTLIKWISERISRRIDDVLQPRDVKLWMKEWPSLIVLDGLDEVTAPGVRAWVIGEIEALNSESAQGNYDAVIMVTTRPTGYSERISPETFLQVDLDYLTLDDAERYSKLVTQYLYYQNFDLQKTIDVRWRRAVDEGGARRLMRTPLQVMIIIVILAQFGSLPGQRYQLFSRYYDTVYAREGEKNTGHAEFILDNRIIINELHERVGLLLHLRAEIESDVRASLTLEDLGSLARDILVEMGYESGSSTDRLVSNLVKISTTRLILLTPSEDETVTFELRSIQELMAARALSSSSIHETIKQLEIIARSAHWRNTWLFIVGRVFSEMRGASWSSVVELVELLDKDEAWPGWLYPSGPELAASMLDDGFAAVMPKWRDRLVNVCLRSLDGTTFYAYEQIASALYDASTSEEKNTPIMIRNALRSALASTNASKYMASQICQARDFGGPISALMKNTPGGASLVDKELLAGSDKTGISVGDIMRREYSSVDVAPGVFQIVEKALLVMDSIPYDTNAASIGHIEGLDRLVSALRNPGANSTLELLYRSVLPENWFVSLILCGFVRTILDHEAKTDQVLATIEWLDHPDGRGEARWRTYLQRDV